MSHPSTSTGEGAALALSALAAIFWGTNFEATRIVLPVLPPFTAAAIRYVIAAGAILLWLWARQGIAWPVLRRNLLAFAVLGTIGVAGFSGALFLGMQTSSPVTAALIMGTSPLTTNLLDALLLRRLPARLAMLGMAISLLGVALTVGAFSGARFAPGDILILAGSLAWALYTIGCRRWVRGATPLETTAWTMLAGTLGLILAAFATEAPLAATVHATVTAWAAILWMALPGSLLGFLFWQVGIARRGPGATAVMFNLVPIAALVVAAALGRMPDAAQIAGVALAIFGILLASDRLLRPRPAPVLAPCPGCAS